MLNSCTQSAQKQADIDRKKNHKQYLPDTIYINNIPRSAEINFWNTQTYPCKKENYI